MLSSLASSPARFTTASPIVFTFALVMCLIAAAASWLRGSAASARNTEAATSDLAASAASISGPEAAAALARRPEMVLEDDA